MIKRMLLVLLLTSVFCSPVFAREYLFTTTLDKFKSFVDENNPPGFSHYVKIMERKFSSKSYVRFYRCNDTDFAACLDNHDFGAASWCIGKRQRSGYNDNSTLNRMLCF